MTTTNLILDQLSERAAQTGVSERITVVNGDMAALDFKAGAFDLIWAEGSAYIICHSRLSRLPLYSRIL
ncbi:MAG: class I SAM-dependent methyltransferase [Pseudanabaenales cyanobacterium]|nr:class I SAM-dependent methyltransferase [Pseudanabaenales cyanobacterium]